MLYIYARSTERQKRNSQKNRLSLSFVILAESLKKCPFRHNIGSIMASPSVIDDTQSITLPHIATELPAIPATVHLGLTVGFMVIFSLLFVFVYIQLFGILYYGYKRLSFQSVFLFLWPTRKKERRSKSVRVRG